MPNYPHGVLLFKLRFVSTQKRQTNQLPVSSVFPLQLHHLIFQTRYPPKANYFYLCFKKQSYHLQAEVTVKIPLTGFDTKANSWKPVAIKLNDSKLPSGSRKFNFIGKADVHLLHQLQQLQMFSFILRHSLTTKKTYQHYLEGLRKTSGSMKNDQRTIAEAGKRQSCTVYKIDLASCLIETT